MNIEMLTWGGAIASGGAEAPVTLDEKRRFYFYQKTKKNLPTSCFALFSLYFSIRFF